MRKARAEDMEVLQRLASEDDHTAVQPTHVFVKLGAEGQEEEIIGCASIASIPLVLPWFHTERCKGRDSRFLIGVMENVLAELSGDRPQQWICVPVVKGSPFEGVMGRLGYLAADEVRLHFKQVKK